MSEADRRQAFSKRSIQRAALDAQTAETQAVERAYAIQKVHPLMADIDLTVEDLSMSALLRQARAHKPIAGGHDHSDSWSGVRT